MYSAVALASSATNERNAGGMAVSHLARASQNLANHPPATGNARSQARANASSGASRPDSTRDTGCCL